MRSTLLASAALLFSTSACAAIHGSGVIRAEARPVTAFSELEVSGGLEVTVRRGDTPSVRVEADDNLLPLVRTEVKGDRLVVRTTAREGLSPTRPIQVAVTVPRLKALAASGGVELDLEAPTEPRFSVEASGGVELRALSLDVETLTVSASGGVQLELAGRAGQAVWDASGGVDVKAPKLLARTVTLDASGGCELDLSASEAVTGDVSGGVDVTIHGDPPKSRVRASGGADVRYADAK